MMGSVTKSAHSPEPELPASLRATLAEASAVKTCLTHNISDDYRLFYF